MPKKKPSYQQLEERLAQAENTLKHLEKKGRAESLETDKELAERYHSLIENSIDGIAIVQAGRISFVNQTIVKIFGYDKDLLIGQEFTRFLAPEYRDFMIKTSTARERGEDVPSRYEFKALRRDGSEFFAEAASSRITYNGTNAVQSIVRDITRRKQAEEKLAESEKLYANITNSSPIGVYIIQNGKFVFVNKKFCQLTGFSKKELLITPPSSLVHPEDRETVRENAIRMLKGRSRAGYEYRGMTKSGEILVVMETVTSIRYKGKRASLGSYMDITERKWTEEQIVKRNRELSVLNKIATTVSQSYDMKQVLGNALSKIREIFAMDCGSIALINRQGEMVSEIAQGFSREFMREYDQMKMGDSLMEIISRSGNKPVLIKDILADSEFAGQGRLKTEGLTTLAGVPLKASDRILGIICIMSMQPNQLSAANMQLLETIGNHLGVIIENVQLREAASKLMAAEEADRLKTELLASVSHELRTPLTAIKGLASSLIQSDVDWDPQTQRDFLKSIDSESDILTLLVSDLLEMSQLETGTTRLEKRPGRISAIINQLKNKLERITKNHRFQIDIPDDLPLLEVDEMRIGQIITNLVSNATFYSEEGSLIILKARQIQDEIVISIIDEGIGIPAEDIERVFDRFCRLQNAVAHRRRGNGLGLSISKRLIEAHNGRIWVENRKTGGSKFCFALPVAETQRLTQNTL